MVYNEIINVWGTATNRAKNPGCAISKFSTDGKPIYTNGDYSVYRYITSYIYTYKNISIAQLVGFNPKLVDSLAADVAPEDSNVQLYLFNRAKETLRKNAHLIV